MLKQVETVGGQSTPPSRLEEQEPHCCHKSESVTTAMSIYSDCGRVKCVNPKKSNYTDFFFTCTWQFSYLGFCGKCDWKTTFHFWSCFLYTSLVHNVDVSGIFIEEVRDAAVTESCNGLEKPKWTVDDTCDLHNIPIPIVHTFVCLLVSIPADSDTHKSSVICTQCSCSL